MVGRGYLGIIHSHPLKYTRSKHTSGDYLGSEIISSHPLKYTRGKQGLSWFRGVESRTSTGTICGQVLAKPRGTAAGSRILMEKVVGSEGNGGREGGE